MIEIFEGVPGGGKSYFAVLRLLAHWSRGGTAYSNLPIKWDACKAYALKSRGVHLKDSQWVPITDALKVFKDDGAPVIDVNTGEQKVVDQVANFQEYSAAGTRELPTLVIIDEAHLYWGSRDWRSTEAKSKKMLAFLTQSRHGHTDIIFITQHHRNLDAQMSRLIQFRWTFRDLARAKIMGIGWPWQTTLAVQWDLDGKTMVSRIFQKRKKEIFTCYDSHAWHTEIARAGQVDKVDVGDGGRASRKPFPLRAVLGGGGVVGGLMWAWWVFHRPISAGAAPVAETSVQSVPVAAPVAAISAPVPVSFSQSAGVFSEGVADIPDTPDRPVATKLFCVDGFTFQDGEYRFWVDTEEYGRLCVGEGDILPPYEILTITAGPRALPDVVALEVDSSRIVSLHLFKRGQPVTKPVKYGNEHFFTRGSNGIERRSGHADLPPPLGDHQGGEFSGLNDGSPVPTLPHLPSINP